MDDIPPVLPPRSARTPMAPGRMDDELRFLVSRHVLAFPSSIDRGVGLQEGMATLQSASSRGATFAVQVLSAECRGSRGVPEHLLSSTRRSGLAEHVLLAGDDAALVARLRAAGFGVTTVDRDRLAPGYGVAAVPMLVVVIDGRVGGRRGGVQGRPIC